MSNKKIKLAINATNIGPQGGINGLVGYLGAWKHYDFPITLYASEEYIINEARKARPDIKIVPFGVGLSYWKHKAFVYARLGKQIHGDGANVLMSTNMLTPRCAVPQLVHHRNAYLFLTNQLFSEINGTVGWKYRLKRYAAVQTIKKSSCNVYISNYLKGLAESWEPESKKKNHVIYNGVYQKELTSLHDRVDLWHGEPVICALQTPAKHKDSVTLIRMLAELYRIDPGIPWRLKIAGGKDESWSEIVELAENIGVLNHVEFLGYLDRSRVLRLLGESMCMVFTSILEGFGNPPIEAMCSGCPVVASNCTAIPEVVGDAGLLVEPGNGTAFAEAVLRIHGDGALRDRLKNSGFERVKQFSWQQSAIKMIELFQEIAC